MLSQHIQWKKNEVREKPRCQCSSKLKKIAPFVAVLLLWALYHQLSNWDGILEPQHHSNKVTAAETEEYTRRWLEFGYNAWLADRIELRRALPDVRDKRCLNISYENLKQSENQVSIIVIFRNEQLAMLLRTLHSLVDRTDYEHIGEIMLINDNSDLGIWKEELSRQAFDAYVRQYIHPLTRIFIMEEHIGLLRARRFAAREAISDTLVFLDAHVEVNVGWLEPLLNQITVSPRTLVCPQLDLLDEQTLNYERVVEQRGLFDWTLRRREVPLLWEQLKELPLPFDMPVPHLSVFAINADWFNSLSHIDMEVTSPAAAELELSFQVWRSGYRILQVPCSRVGHLQPSDLSYLQRYGDLNQLGKQHFSSYKRLVETWLHESKYQSVVYQYQPQIQEAHVDSVSEVLGLIKNVSFESFDWYLEHVATDLLQYFPPLPRTDFANGTLRPAQSPNHCLTGNLATGRITLEPCASSLQHSQNWTLTYMNDLRLGYNYCVEVLPNRMLALKQCHTLGGRQSWHFQLDDYRLVSNIHCLQFDAQLNLTARRYNSMKGNQMWYFEHINIEAMKLNSL